MFDWVKVEPTQRVLIEVKTNHYKLAGPGWVFIPFWQRHLTTLTISVQGQAFVFNEVQTAERIPLEVSVQVIYRIDPGLFSDELRPNLRGLNEGGWLNVLRWQTEYVLRLLLADHTWDGLGREGVQSRLERQITSTLAGRLKTMGLNISNVALIKTSLPPHLQHTLIRAEQDGVEAKGRATVLKEYFNIFGRDLPQAMPYIVQWELMNMLHKDGNLQLWSTANFPFAPAAAANGGDYQNMFQMTLPLPQKPRQGKELTLQR